MLGRCLLWSPCLCPLLIAAACTDVTSDAPCADGAGRCEGNVHQICAGGEYVPDETCAGALSCYPSIGCGECDPEVGAGCVGSTVHACEADGSLGGALLDCGGSGCSLGRCNDDCTVTGSDLIFVIDDEANLYSFDPRLIGMGEPFVAIGQIDCPAGEPWPDYDGPSRPFSMSIDRSGRAWVLYSSGEIFWVSTVDARCVATPFVPDEGGFELFGMGFTSNGPGETLYISGGPLDPPAIGDLGTINPATFEVAAVGPLTTTTIGARATPELTGTGDGHLYGYYPGNESAIVEIDKTDGSELTGWELDPPDGSPSAWAFAHWGGRFYVFSTTTLGIEETTDVVEVDPSEGTQTTVLGNLPFRIVGAGVSTCAPSVL